MPLITYITVCKNAAKTIGNTIRSVSSLPFEDYEYIIIDGGSTDGTVSLLRQFEPMFAGKLKWMSESDKGIYDAMNKGIRMSTGTWVNFLNDGDMALMVPAGVLQSMEVGGYDVIAFSVSSEQGVLKSDVGMTLRFRNTLQHQGVFYRRKALFSVGGYNTSYKILGDHDLNLRLLRGGVGILVKDDVVAYHSLGGISCVGGDALRKEMRKVVFENYGVLMLCVAFFEHKLFGLRQWCARWSCFRSVFARDGMGTCGP